MRFQTGFVRAMIRSLVTELHKAGIRDIEVRIKVPRATWDYVAQPVIANADHFAEGTIAATNDEITIPTKLGRFIFQRTP